MTLFSGMKHANFGVCGGRDEIGSRGVWMVHNRSRAHLQVAVVQGVREVFDFVCCWYDDTWVIWCTNTFVDLWPTCTKLDIGLHPSRRRVGGLPSEALQDG